MVCLKPGALLYTAIEKGRKLELNRVYAVIFILGLALVLSGCQSVNYYIQAIEGQISILNDRRPVSELLNDPRTPEQLKTRLEYLLEVRIFAQDELSLPVGNNYLSYVDLRRPCVVWNVFAAAEFSLAPKIWCYPVVGCASYRGYFTEKAAHDYASFLKENGYDVYVGGVTAYSTLGWFDDPILSTVIGLSATNSAALIFHELAHRVLYVRDDTAFNESFATAVEQEAVRRWLKSRESSEAYNRYLDQFQLHHQFVELIMKYRDVLEQLYCSRQSESEKRLKKDQIMRQLKNEHEILKKNNPGLSRYDDWFRQPLNNAQLISVLAYQDFVPAFQKMIHEKNGDLKQFYEACRLLAEKHKDERNRRLRGYLSN
jgi:predicted aminopeptidase